jgi:hypothetical protein
MKAQPDFFCIGAAKAGTRWLYDQLLFHPQVWMPPMKELHYFDGGFRFAPEKAQAALARLLAGKRWTQKGLRRLDERDVVFRKHAATHRPGTVDFAWYGELFAPKGEAISGDITPAYSRLAPDMVSAIAQAFPRLKIILLVRDPVERYWSARAMGIRKRASGGIAGRELQAFYDEVRAKTPRVIARFSQVEAARIWRSAFGEQQFFIGQFDDLQSRADWLLAQIFTFLGIDADRVAVAVPADLNRKAGNWKPDMPADIRAKLADSFRDELRASAEEFGGAARTWAARYGF